MFYFYSKDFLGNSLCKMKIYKVVIFCIIAGIPTFIIEMQLKCGAFFQILILAVVYFSVLLFLIVLGHAEIRSIILKEIYGIKEKLLHII